MMLQINDINELRPKVAHEEEIRESKISDDLTTFCYMIAAENTFDDVWSRECRGIVFNRKGKVCARPVHKFFNVGERDETRPENMDWSRVVRVMEKRDGSMIHTVIEPMRSHAGLEPKNRMLLKSKKSTESDVARAAYTWVREEEIKHIRRNLGNREVQQRNIARFIEKIGELNCTAIFEWTAPDARIVLYYPNAELQLLHVRENESGRYWSVDELHALADPYNVKVVDEVSDFYWEMGGEGEGIPYTREFDIRMALEAAQTREEVEGWVIQFDNGDMVKLKTAWYLKRHKAMTFLRERDIVELVLANGLDDLKSLLVSEGVDIAEILKIEESVIQDIRDIERDTHAIAAKEDFSMPRKDFVFKYREKAGLKFGLLMNLYSGKVPDYQDFFLDHVFKQKYTLRQLNLIPSKAEQE